MGFIERRDVYRPDKGEAPFEIEEMFFSRTDDRGIIQSANFIFQRVADYSWDQLLGAPHKIIRHPDMPKGVFHLFWDTLKKGEPIGAYVLNKAHDGLHYWVYAVAMPYEGGYLSVRIKPSSEILPVVKALYEKLRAAELDDGVSAEDSSAMLLKQISKMNFPSYGAFASYALGQELAARDVQMDKAVDAATEPFAQMLKAASDLNEVTKKFANDFEAISTVPTNMRIIAARLEPSGGAVSSLSQNYWEMSEEMSHWFQAHVLGDDSGFTMIRITLENSHFLFGLSRILTAVAMRFGTERRALGAIDLDTEKTNMNKLAALYADKAIQGLNQVAAEAERITNAISVMRRFTLGLSSTRVMCNIESARLPSGGGSLVDVIRQLGTFQEGLDTQLEKIEDLSHIIQSNAETLVANRKFLKAGA